MSAGGNRQLLSTREEACTAVKRIISGDDSRFEMVPFEKFNRTAKLRSQYYKGYFVICHVNTVRSAGWLLCRYTKNGRCPLEKGLYCFKAMQGGTSRLERHTASHKNHSGIVRFERSLPAGAKPEIARAAAVAAALDIRPLSFCDGHVGMRCFAQAIFEMGQTVPESERIDPKSYLPGRTAVTNAVRDLSASLRRKFVAEMKEGLLKYGGAVTCDGVHLKLQGKQYFDLTLHFMEVKVMSPFEKDSFKLRNITLLLVEAPDLTTAPNIQKCLGDGLMLKSNIVMEELMRDFTMVTDGAAVMAKVANASVSRDLHAPDETWMRCIAHLLNNTMKSVFSTKCCSDILQVVALDFRAMKRIVEDGNRTGWNHHLPHGYKLLQESETRFGTHYQVAERFLKSAPHLSGILETARGSSAQKAYDSLKKSSNVDGTVTGFPGIEAIFDGFGIVVDCIDRFETSLRPTLHIALPIIIVCCANLMMFDKAKKVWRGEDKQWAHPSVYSREMFRVLREELLRNSWDHTLLLLGCYLNPIFREMEFIEEFVERKECREKAEEFARKLDRKQRLGNFPGDQSEAIGGSSLYLLDVDDYGETEKSFDYNVGGKKRPFDLLDCVDSVQSEKVYLDEVSKYNLSQVNYLREARIKFLEDDFEVMRYWHERKAQFPLLFTIATRVFATPVSSASSERVFSALKQLVSEKRSC